MGDALHLRAALTTPIAQSYALLTEPFWATSLAAHSEKNFLTDSGAFPTSPRRLLEFALVLSNKLATFIVERVVHHYNLRGLTLDRITAQLNKWSSKDDSDSNEYSDYVVFTVHQTVVNLDYNALRRRLAHAVIAPSLLNQAACSYNRNDTKSLNPTPTDDNSTINGSQKQGVVLNESNSKFKSNKDFNDQNGDSSSKTDSSDSLDSAPSAYPAPVDFLMFWLLVDGVVDLQPEQPLNSFRKNSRISLLLADPASRERCYEEALPNGNQPLPQLQLTNNTAHCVHMLSKLRDHILRYAYNFPDDVALNTIFDAPDKFVNLKGIGAATIPKVVIVEAFQRCPSDITKDSQWGEMKNVLMSETESQPRYTLSELGFVIYQWISFAGSPLLRNAVQVVPKLNLAGTGRLRRSIVDGQTIIAGQQPSSRNTQPTHFQSPGIRNTRTSSASLASSECRRSPTYVEHRRASMTTDQLMEQANQLLEESQTLEQEETTSKTSHSNHFLESAFQALDAAQRAAQNAITASGRLSRQLDAAEHRKQELMDRVADLESRIEVLYEEESTASHQKRSLQAALKACENRIRALEETCAASASEKSSLIATTRNLERQLAERSRERSTARDPDKSNNAASCISPQVLADQMIKPLELRNQHLQQQLATTQKQLLDATSELESMRTVAQEAKTAAQASAEQCTSLNEKTRDLEQELYALKAKPLAEFVSLLSRAIEEHNEPSLHQELEHIKHLRSYSVGVGSGGYNDSFATHIAHKRATTWEEETQLAWSLLEAEFKEVKRDLYREDKPATATRRFAAHLVSRLETEKEWWSWKNTAQKSNGSLGTDDALASSTVRLPWTWMQMLLSERLCCGWTMLHLFLALMLPEALTIFLAKQQSEKKAVNDDDEKLHVSVPSRVKEIFEANDLFGQPNDILPTRGSDPADLYFLIMQTTSSAGLTPLHLSAALAPEQTFRLLVTHGANALAPDARGNTPLHWLGFRKTAFDKVDLEKLLNWSSRFLPPVLSLDSVCSSFCNFSGYPPEFQHKESINFRAYKRRPHYHYICHGAGTATPQMQTTSIIMPENWSVQQAPSESHCPYVNYVSRGHVCQGVSKELIHCLDYSTAEEFLQKLVELPVPTGIHDYQQLLNHKVLKYLNGNSLLPAGLSVLSFQHLLDIPFEELARGFWTTTVTNFTCNGVAECYIPVTMADSAQGTYPPSQTLIITDTRLVLIGQLNKELSSGKSAPAEVVLLNVTLEDISNVLVFDNSDHVCLLSIHGHSDCLLDISRRNEFLRLLYYYRCEQHLDNTDGATNATAAKRDVITLRFDKLIYLCEKEERPASLLAFIELESFLLLPYNPQSLLLQYSCSLVHFGFLGICVNPPSPLVFSVSKPVDPTTSSKMAAGLIDENTEISGAILWKEFFVLLHDNGSMHFCNHPNDNAPAFSFNIRVVHRIRLFNYATMQTRDQKCRTKVPCQPLLALDFAPHSSPPSLIFHLFSEIDRSRWKEALDFVLSHKPVT